MRKTLFTYHLLIMGNDKTLSKNTIAHLNKKGVEVLFISGNKKSNQLKKKNAGFDAILIDYDQNSLNLPEKINALCSTQKNKPKLILTAQFRTLAMAQAMQSGFDEFLAKPLHSTELITVIKKPNKNKF